MSDDIEVPRRGYDTKDVEAMSRAADAAEAGSRKTTPVVIGVVIAVAAVLWFLLTR
jgi:hypothetical protein